MGLFPNPRRRTDDRPSMMISTAEYVNWQSVSTRCADATLRGSRLKPRPRNRTRHEQDQKMNKINLFSFCPFSFPFFSIFATETMEKAMPRPQRHVDERTPYSKIACRVFRRA